MKTIWLINQYASTPQTGIGGRHFYLARELARRGHRVYLIAAGWHHLLRNNDAHKAAPLIEEVEGFSFVRIPMPRYGHAQDKRRILNWFLFAWQLVRLPRTILDRPDAIVYSSPSPFGFLGAERLARRFGAKLVFEVRDIWPLTLTEIGGFSHRNPVVRVMQWIEDRAYQVSDRVISNLPRAVEHMTSRGMDSRKFCWIPNGFSGSELEAIEPLPNEVEARFPKKKFVVGYAGTIGTANAMDVFIDAAALLKNNQNIAFAMAGDGRERKELQNKAFALGLNNIHFLDSVPKVQVQSVLKLFDVCFVGSKKSTLYRFGTSPNKLFDYFAAGRPIIYGIDSPGYAPVTDIGAGLSVPPGDAIALAQAVLGLYSMSNSERIRMGESGRKSAFKYYEYEILAKKLERVLFPVAKTEPLDNEAY